MKKQKNLPKNWRGLAFLPTKHPKSTLQAYVLATLSDISAPMSDYLLMYSFTSSAGIIFSSNAYAPVLGDLNILMTFV